MTGSPAPGHPRQDRLVHPLRLRSAAALLTVIAGGATLAGCSGSDHDSAVPEDYTRWMNHAFAQLNGVTADSHGGAGGRLTVEDGGKRAHAHVSLEYDLAGPHDVLAAGRSGVALDASTTDRSGKALFDTLVVSRGAGQ